MTLSEIATQVAISGECEMAKFAFSCVRFIWCICDDLPVQGGKPAHEVEDIERETMYVIKVNLI